MSAIRWAEAEISAKRRASAIDLEDENIDGEANAQAAMSDAEEERAGATDECTVREEDAKHRTRARHDDDRMRELWAHELKVRFCE